LFYHFTPLFNNWGIIQLNENMLFHSLVFANAKFVESANE
jgi:hypothetical protein